MSEEQFPLPWDPDESCKLNEESVPTRLSSHPEEEIRGTLFDKDCDGKLDTTIQRRNDKFIDCVEIPEVPKAKLLKEDYAIVPFSGLPEVELPKRLMAHLLGCCLKDRTAGFGFEAEEELDGNGDKVELDFEDSDNPVTKAFTIQLGTEGFSYLRFGLNIKPELCFCDEDCGDEDYIHLKVNFGVEYHDENDDPIQDPDLVIEDEQLTNLISNFGGGGGGGNPLCSRKLFGVFLGESNASTGYFVPYDLQSYTVSDLVYAGLAPYLAGFSLVHDGIYKLEYFCEHNAWFVTDGQCSNIAPLYAYPSYVLIEKSGLPNETFTGTLILQNGGELYPYDDCTPFPFALDSSASTDTEANTFVNGITFTKVGNMGLSVKYSFQIKEGADASLVYTTVLSNSTGSCNTKPMKFIFKIKDNTPEVEEEEEEE